MPAGAPLTETELWRRHDDAEQRLTAPVSERMLELARLERGMRVLDIATGRGEPALRAAARVGPDGLVLGTDRSADMLRFAQARATAQALGNLHLQVADAETLAGVPEAAFDAALCRWGLMYVDRPRQALASVRRCLRAGGVFVAAVWTAPASVPYWSMPRDVLARHVPLPPVDDGAPGTFRYAAAGRLRADLADAGFATEHEEELATPVMEARTPEGLVDWCLDFGLRRLLAGHPEAVAAAWRRDMLAEAPRHRDADGTYRLGGVTRLVVARASVPPVQR